MRLESFDDSSQLNAPHRLRGRLETLLSLWSYPAPWQRHESKLTPFASSDDAELWVSFVVRAQPVEPVSTIHGLADAIRRQMLVRSSDEPAWSIDFVQANGIALVDGPRVAVRDLVAAQGPRIPAAHAWRLSLPCDDDEAERLTEVCRATFAIVERLPGELSVGEPHPAVPQGATILARLAFGVTDSGDLLGLWRKATALGVADTWIDLLDPDQRRALASALAAELVAAAPKLGWHADLALEGFFENREIAPGRTTFASRLDEIFWAQFILQQPRDSLAPQCVYIQMARAVVLAGTSTQIGNFLCDLPPGRAYFAAIDVLRSRRPHQIASLLAHFAFAPEAAVALADWPDVRSVQGQGRMTMREEWLEVMQLSRRLALFHDHGPDYVAALALAAHDEARDSVPEKHRYGRAPVPSVAARMDPWKERLATEEHACRAVDAAAIRLQRAPTDADFVVALRLVAILEQAHEKQADRLAVAVVDAYVRSFSLSESASKRPPRLVTHADLLDILGRVLVTHTPEAWARWCKPFDSLLFARRSYESLEYPITGNTITPMLDCPRFVRGHASHLLSAAAVSSPAQSIELVESFVQLFEQTHGKMYLDAWSWDRRFADEAIPLMACFAQILMRLPENEAEAYVDRLVDADATVLHMAELLWGFEGRSRHAAAIERRVHRRVEPLLKDGDLQIGHANALGVALYQAKMPALAERFAEYVIGTLNDSRLHAAGPVREIALQVLFASRVAQEKWADVDNTDPLMSELGDHALVENLRALGDLKRGKIEAALGRLDRLLRRHPQNAMALTNATAAYAARGDWSACLIACDLAHTALGDGTPPEVGANEARAHYRLGAFGRAAAVLDRLPADIGRAPELIKLRIALAIATAPVVSRIAEDLRELERIDPVEADQLRARLAPLSDAEIGGAWFASGSLQRRFVSFEERCAAIRSGEPEMVLLSALASAAQRISEKPALARGMNEDNLTQLLCAYLIVLERVRIFAQLFAPGGWGPKREGLADFALTEMSEHGLSHGRCIVRGEAKLWKSPAWMVKGMQQIFGTANTGQELFLALIIFSKVARFESTVTSVRDTLAGFGSETPTPFATIEAPEEAKLTSGTSLRVFKTRHRQAIDDAASPVRTLYTFVVDVVSEPSRSIRRP